MTIKIPQTVRDFSEALDAWNVAACRWLGLDPARVTKLSVGDTEQGLVKAAWESIGQETPRDGWIQYGARLDGDTHVFTGSIVLDSIDTNGFKSEVGPMPKMFTAEERASLMRVLG